jgi:uncharacterized protein YndB with AHSA1/START domain
VDPVTVETTVARPREEVFAYLADVANHPEFSDHYLTDWRLTREDSVGQGAGARFRLKQRFNRFAWADVTFVEVERPRRIVEAGRAGKFNRIRLLGVWELDPASGGITTRVNFTLQTQPKMPSDKLRERLGGARWFKRGARRALRRLRDILEEAEPVRRGPRATIAGGPRKPATGAPLRG